MRSEEREEKNATQESGDAAMPAMRGYDAEGRGVLGQVLEVPEQAVPMANVGELGGGRMKDKLTKDCLDSYLCDAFTELRPFLEIHHKEMIKEMEQAYQQIRKLIEEKPRVTKAWANGWIGCLHGRWKIPVTQADAIVYGMLDEANIKVDK